MAQRDVDPREQDRAGSDEPVWSRAGGSGDAWARSVSAGIAKGDRGALGALYEAWFDRAYSMARRATGGRGEDFCMDVVQEAFVRVIRSMRAVKSEAQLGAWMKRVVTSAAYDMLRKEMRLEKQEREGARADVAGSAESGHSGERIEWLREEMVRLGVEERELLELRHRFGMTLREMGARVGLGAGAVDRRVTRVVEAMRERGRELSDE